jgi:hypothetical protein
MTIVRMICSVEIAAIAAVSAHAQESRNAGDDRRAGCDTEKCRLSV